jgi:hypothetical protein
MAGKSSKMKSRLSTIRYEMTRDFMSDFASKRVPQFTEEHENKLMEIFEIPNLKTCIVTGEKVAKSGGDHLFEVRGYLKKTGKVGIEQKWNRLPVSTGENIRYKKYKFTENGKEYVKNIGYELLTEDELRQCSKEKKALYHKIRNWVNYCERQNVSLGYIMPKEAEKEMEIAIEKAMEILLLGIENMKNSV